RSRAVPLRLHHSPGGRPARRAERGAVTVFSAFDLVILLLVLLFAVSGFRQGFVVSALSFVGFLGGAALGLQLASPIATRLAHGTGRVIVALVVVVVSAMLGQVGGVWVGNQVRPRVAWRAGP